MLDIFALVVIFVIVALALWLIITIASFPGKLANKNNHPQVQAVNTLAWLGCRHIVGCSACVGTNKISG